MLACTNPPPPQPSASPADDTVLGDHLSLCELAEPAPSLATSDSASRSLLEASALAWSSDATYASGEQHWPDALVGSYAMALTLDVWMQDTPDEPASYDPGRGEVRLWLRAEIDEKSDEARSPQALLRVCGLELPPQYAYATSGVTELFIPQDSWEAPDMPRFLTQMRVSASAASMRVELDAFAVLLGISLAETAAPWPSYMQTPSFPCEADHIGEACFPDQDDDGEPGLSFHVRGPDTDVDSAPYPACETWRYLSPSTTSEPWLGSPAPASRLDRLFVGLRTALQLSLELDVVGEVGAGTVAADDIVTRVLDCYFVDAARCAPRQAEVVDAHAPTFHVLGQGRQPPESFHDSRALVDAALDRRPSDGGHVSIRRLLSNAADTCDAVRAAFDGDAR